MKIKINDANKHQDRSNPTLFFFNEVQTHKPQLTIILPRAPLGDFQRLHLRLL